MAVIGFEDIEPCFSTRPALTTVNQQFDEVGALAARLSIDEMRSIQHPHGRQVSSSNLVVRTSCGCTPDGQLRLGADRLAEAVEAHLSRAARLEATTAEQYAVSMSLLDRQGSTRGRWGGCRPRTCGWVPWPCGRGFPTSAALRVVERIQRTVAEPLLVPTGEVRVTASIGIAVAGPASTSTAEDILRDADAAMYRAKAALRGSWALHGCDLPGRVPV